MINGKTPAHEPLTLETARALLHAFATISILVNKDANSQRLAEAIAIVLDALDDYREDAAKREEAEDVSV